MSFPSDKKRLAAFKDAFGGESGEIVLNELSKFCGEFDGTLAVDERQGCYWHGRRSVILEIREQLKKEFRDE